MDAVLLASVVVAILLVGGGIGYWIGRSGVGGNKARVAKAEAELEEYKRNVSEHFGETAAHFQAIGKQYRELYEHMANGAEALCETDEAGKKLLFAPGTAAASADAEEPPVETTVQTDARGTKDQAEQPIAEEAAEERETIRRPEDEHVADTAADVENAETEEKSIPEEPTESETDAKAEADARTRY